MLPARALRGQQFEEYVVLACPVRRKPMQGVRQPGFIRHFIRVNWKWLVAVTGLTATGCAVQLNDRTQPRLLYDAPLNVQEFEADVSVGGRREIRQVTIEVDGSMDAMMNTGDDRWLVRKALPVCDEVVGYRFLVDYDDAGDTSPPFRRKVFPDSGRFVRPVLDQPAECEGEPGIGDDHFRVVDVSDAPDAVPGDGYCSTTVSTDDPASVCTLRAAVMESNATPGLNFIELVRGSRYVLTVEGGERDDEPDASVGDLDITDSVVIRGGRGFCTPFSTTVLDLGSLPEPFRLRESPSGTGLIDANGIDRVIDIYGGDPEAPVEVYLQCVTLTGGARLGPNRGFTNQRGGAVLNRGHLVMEHAIVVQNSIRGQSSRGAGIFNTGRLIVRDSALVHNDGRLAGAVAGGTDGGAISNDVGGHASIERSLIAYNEATRGPAIFNGRYARGGLPEPPPGAVARLSVSNSTIAFNTGGDSSGDWRAGVVNLNHGLLQSGWSTLHDDDNPLVYNTGRIEVGNSLLSAPGTDVCSFGDYGFISLGGNWMSSGECLRRADSGDTVSRSIGLYGALEVNNGFTPTMAIRPAAGGAPGPVDAPAVGLPLCPAVDQRGFPRPVDGSGNGRSDCDAGAFEFNAERP
jgi:hypothetical protein